MDINNLILFFLCLLSPSSANSKSLCPISYCSSNTLPIKYPFKLQGQHHTPNCTYTNLKCSNQGALIFTLPSFGDFFVRSIVYEYKSPLILLHDPQNCLPKRFMDSESNYSAITHEEAAYFHDYTFYSCPPNNVAWREFPTIGCLSNSTSDVVAIRADIRETKADLGICKEMYTLSMPVLRRGPPRYIKDEKEFFLEVNASRCGSCTTYKERWGNDFLLHFIYYVLILVHQPIMKCCLDLQ